MFARPLGQLFLLPEGCRPNAPESLRNDVIRLNAINDDDFDY